MSGHSEPSLTAAGAGLLSIDTVLDQLARQRKDLDPEDVRDHLWRFRLWVPDAGAPAQLHHQDGRFWDLSGRASSQLLGLLGLDSAGLAQQPWRERHAAIENRMRRSDRQVVVRTAGRAWVRAIFTSKYTPLDDADILPDLLDLLRPSGAAVTNLGFGLRSTYLRIVFPDGGTEVRPGDRLHVGIQYLNSEVGYHSLRLSWLVWRLVCRNGLVVRDSYTRAFRHIGDPGRLRSVIRARLMCLSVGSSDLVDRFRTALGLRLLYPEAAIGHFAREHGLGSAKAGAIVTAWGLEPDPTLYGVINAFTRAAQREPTVEARLRMEHIGSLLLENAA